MKDRKTSTKRNTACFKGGEACFPLLYLFLILSCCLLFDFSIWAFMLILGEFLFRCCSHFYCIFSEHFHFWLSFYWRVQFFIYLFSISRLVWLFYFSNRIVFIQQVFYVVLISSHSQVNLWWLFFFSNPFISACLVLDFHFNSNIFCSVFG